MKMQSLICVLPISILLLSPPVFAVDAVGGSATNTNIVVNATGCQAAAGNWTILRSVNFTNPTTRYCIATGSADAVRPTTTAGPENYYYFTVSNAPNPICDQGQERTLTFWNQGNTFDNTIKEVTTTGGWMSTVAVDPGYFTAAANPLIFGSRTLYFLARKASTATPNLTVLDASLTVTCTDNRLVPPILIPIDPVITQ